MTNQLTVGDTPNLDHSVTEVYALPSALWLSSIIMIITIHIHVLSPALNWQ